MPNLLPATTTLTATKAPDAIEILLSLEVSTVGTLDLSVVSTITPVPDPAPPPADPMTHKFGANTILSALVTYHDRVKDLKALRALFNAQGWATNITSTGLDFL
jgi:hypothetical protein